jgi:hypothetical protein
MQGVTKSLVVTENEIATIRKCFDYTLLTGTGYSSVLLLILHHDTRIELDPSASDNG